MSIVHLIRVGLSMSPGQAARRAVKLGVRLAETRLLAAWRGRHCSYAEAEGVLTPRLTAGLDFSLLAPLAATVAALGRETLDHRFDLLGSGWVTVAHGETYGGFGPHRHGPGPALPAGTWRPVVAAWHRPGNRRRAEAILGLIQDADWRPIDWQVDFKSGFRWPQAAWGRGVSYGHRPGVDIKLPWELARFQHGPWLAQAHALARLGRPGFVAAERYVAEFRHQVLDFLGANPPGWGVNWCCTMDVAIRAANMLMAWDLFRAQGVVFDAAFEAELAAAMIAHGRHIVRFLEWDEHHRGNHYLSNLAGLAFIAAYLPDHSEVKGRAGAKGWRAFAAERLAVEIPRQFGADGANFEASTAYHRLSAEMAVYGVAVLGGAVEPAHLERLARAAYFSADVTKPSGAAVQVGDNDSGRFLKLTPLFDGAGDGLRERHLDHRGFIAAARGLLELELLADPVAAFETAVVAALAGGERRVEPRPAPAPVIRHSPEGAARHLTRVRIIPGDPTAFDGMSAAAYPDFGLYSWKGARAFVSLRCGPVGQNGNGGHAHNDQLAVEIEIDGIAWACDPGTFVYTADLAARNRYRSALAHVVPRHGGEEPARMIAPFRLEDRARAEILRFGPDILGWHRGFSEAVFRRVALEDGAIVIEDFAGGPSVDGATQVEEHVIASPAQLSALWGLGLPFSPGYGLIDD
ncbi:MAG: heparinase II/III family protein [Phaeospirillum sp.]|nr:heparinase II/III family protein [Phaeospirillum sp.]